MAFPYNPQLSFKPSETHHYVAFDSDSSELSNQNDYMIHFESPYKNVVSISIESACLPKGDNDYVTLKLNDIDNVQSAGIMTEDGKIQREKAIDNAFAIFHFDHSTEHDGKEKQFFVSSDIIPNTKHLQSPIGRLASLHVRWESKSDNAFTDNNHVFVLKITTIS